MQTDAREHVNYAGSNVSNAVNGATYFVNAVIVRIDGGQGGFGGDQDAIEQAIEDLNNNIDYKTLFANLKGKGVITEPISESAVRSIKKIITDIEAIDADAGNQYNSVNDLKEA